ncbi:MAG: pirin family protein [Steroidobacteraceae bacterium]|jgi:redox-sensitive bicupin YhaK (pirin superfamily)
MWALRRSSERGLADHGWLKSRHSFSFADYHDPEHMGFSALRVINEDRVAPAQGFGTHGHRDMEILSYVLEGQLGHRDSMGTGSVILPGDVQRMSAGSGVTHSEMNPSKSEPVHFLQIWILPAVKGMAPGYEQKHFDEASKRGQLKLVASPDGAAGSVLIHQDARMYAGLFDGAEQTTFETTKGRAWYLHLARGSLKVNDTELAAGDALMLTDACTLVIHEGRNAELLLFDLPGDGQR